jgi:type II secretory ATPase GspE/PulE/Tfp pilus assembly ATPase PilB-like protein
MQDDGSLERLREQIDSPTIIRLVNLIISQGIYDRASAIHIEPKRIRYRVDGTLYEVMAPPEETHRATTGRLKIMGGMDLAEWRVPQSGQIRMQHEQIPYRLQLSVIPCEAGEKVVIHIRAEEPAQLLGLNQLELSPENLNHLLSILQQPSGLLLVSGFRRGGKSSTLYACLNHLNDGTRNLQSMEDPVKIPIPGVNQVAIQPKVGLTFPSALRACLRSDADVIMVGQVHGYETCQLAVDAACNGHLVLAASQNYSAASSLLYLIHCGVEPYLVSLALKGALSQRLARRLCPDCKSAAPAPPGFGLETIYVSAGCPTCKSVGSRGQIGIQELMRNSPSLRDCLARSPNHQQLVEVAREQGMLSLREDGLKKVAEGKISLAEMLQVTRD